MIKDFLLRIRLDGQSETLEGPSQSPRFSEKDINQLNITINGRNAIFGVGIGYLSNRKELEKLFDESDFRFDSSFLDDFSFLANIISLKGSNLLSKAIGYFCAVLFLKHSVILVSSMTPGPALYYHFEGKSQLLTVGSRLKYFGCNERPVRSFRTFSEAILFRFPSSTIFSDVVSLVAGHFVIFELREDLNPTPQKYFEPSILPEIKDENEACHEIKNSLNIALGRIPGKEAFCLVSGGLDSSIVCTIATSHFSEITLFSAGSKLKNEFKEATSFSKSIGKKCNLLTYPDKWFEQNIVQTIAILEHPFSRYIEYILPVLSAIELMPKENKVLLTGYGSDILFAGQIDLKNTSTETRIFVEKEYFTTLWSKETTHSLSRLYGSLIAFPFFDPEVVNIAFRLDPSLLFRNGIEKFILRRAFKGQIPLEITTRRKIGIHESTGTESIFSQFFQNENLRKYPIRRMKDFICYLILKDVLCNKIKIGEIDFKQFVSEIKDIEDEFC